MEFIFWFISICLASLSLASPFPRPANSRGTSGERRAVNDFNPGDETYWWQRFRRNLESDLPDDDDGNAEISIIINMFEDISRRLEGATQMIQELGNNQAELINRVTAIENEVGIGKVQPTVQSGIATTTGANLGVVASTQQVTTPLNPMLGSANKYMQEELGVVEQLLDEAEHNIDEAKQIIEVDHINISHSIQPEKVSSQPEVQQSTDTLVLPSSPSSTPTPEGSYSAQGDQIGSAGKDGDASNEGIAMAPGSKRYPFRNSNSAASARVLDYLSNIRYRQMPNFPRPALRREPVPLEKGYRRKQ